MPPRGPLNAFSLKLIMAAFMLLDHLYYYLPDMPDWFTWLGRLVAPVFCYLMTEGMRYTSDRIRYIRRLLGAGLVMLLGNTVLSLLFMRPLQQNIFLSLGVSACVLYCSERMRLRIGGGGNAVLLALLVLFSGFCEGGIMVPVMALIFYYLDGKQLLMCVCYAAAMVPIVWMYWQGQLFPQILMVFAVVPILLYSGKRGPGSVVAKYFFYVFYPLHVWVLFVVRQIYFKG